MKRIRKPLARSGINGGRIGVIALNLAICVIATGIYVFEDAIGPTACALGGAMLCLATVAIEAAHGINLVLLYRLFLLGTFALFAVPELVLLPQFALSPTMLQFQTVDNAAGLAVISALALAATSIAWHVCMLRRPPIPPVPHDGASPPALTVIFLVLGTAFCIIHAATSPIIMLGALDYGSAAANSGQGHLLEINTWGFAGLSCFINIWIIEFRTKQRLTFKRAIILAYTLAVIVYAFVLRGFRAEFVTFSITCLILYWQFRARQRITLRLVTVAASLVIGLGIFTLVMGAVRDAGSASAAKAAALEAINPEAETYEAVSGANIPTLNWLPNVGAAPLVLCVIGLHREKAYDFMWGATLWQRIEDTLPRIINPLRTKDLAYIYVDKFNVVSTGGMPELAEDFLNFGIFGGLLVSGFISWLIFLSYRRALVRDDLQSWTLCVAILMSLIYSNIYGIGHVYKAALTGVMLNVMLFYIYNVIVVGRGE